MASTITFPFDTWAIDRVEILKGPASVLYGQGGVAGAYNVVPKSPSAEFGTDLRLSLGQDGESFLGASLTGALSNSVTGRIDYSNGQSDNWVNNGASETEMLALALEWQASEDLTLAFRYDAGDQSLRSAHNPTRDGTDRCQGERRPEYSAGRYALESVLRTGNDGYLTGLHIQFQRIASQLG